MENTRTMKYCSKCDQTKEQADFSNSVLYRKQNWCKQCYSDYYKAYNEVLRYAEAKVYVDSKVCLDCKLKKPRSQFGHRANSPDKLNSYCKPCWRTRTAEAKRRMKARRSNG